MVLGPLYLAGTTENFLDPGELAGLLAARSPNDARADLKTLPVIPRVR